MHPIQIFAMYFASLVSMNFHPGYHKGEDPATVTFDELEMMADIADRMMDVTLKRLRRFEGVKEVQ